MHHYDHIFGRPRHCAPPLLLLLHGPPHHTGDSVQHTQYFIKLTTNIHTTNINKCLSNICKYIHVVLLVIIKLIKFKSRVLVCSRVPPPLRAVARRRRHDGAVRAVDN